MTHGWTPDTARALTRQFVVADTGTRTRRLLGRLPRAGHSAY